MRFEVTEQLQGSGFGGGSRQVEIDVPEGQEPPEGAVPITEQPKGRKDN